MTKAKIQTSPRLGSPAARKYTIIQELIRADAAGRPMTARDIATKVGPISSNTIHSDIQDVIETTGLFRRETRKAPVTLRPIRCIMEPRHVEKVEAKMALARTVHRVINEKIKDFDQIYLDGGTTGRIVYEDLVENPPRAQLPTVFINDVCVGLGAPQASINTVMLPGTITGNFTVCGPKAEAFVRASKFDVSILSCSEINLVLVEDEGVLRRSFVLVSTAAEREVGLKMLVLTSSAKLLFAADNSKFHVIEIEVNDNRLGIAKSDLDSLPTLLPRLQGCQKYDTFAWGVIEGGTKTLSLVSPDTATPLSDASLQVVLVTNRDPEGATGRGSNDHEVDRFAEQLAAAHLVREHSTADEQPASSARRRRRV